MTTVLRESAQTAARERARLEATAGRSRPAAFVARLPVLARRLGTDDAARSGLRYQPVAWTAIALAVVAFWFPGRDSSDDAATASAVVPPSATTTVAPAASDVAATPTPTPTPVVAPPVNLPRPAAGPSAGSSPPTTVAPAAPPVTSAPPEATPLSVRGFGWAARLSGTGLSTADVPEGSMPVANRLGQLDKASFVRLAGSDATLTLTEVADGAREAVGGALVVACPITDAGWREEPDQSLEAAPPWNESACVTGVESEDTWTFDLTGFDVDADTGFALVPDASAPPDFQITFASA